MTFSGINDLINDMGSESVVYLKRDSIVPDENQTRKNWDSPKLIDHVESLTKSMMLVIPDTNNPNSTQLYGIREPLSVEKIGQGQYKIVKGESRWRAAGIAGIDDIPCIIKKYSSETNERRYDHVTENSLRLGLNLYEQAIAIKEDIEKNIPRRDILIIYNLKNESQLSKLLSILKVDPVIQEAAQNRIIEDINLIYELKNLKKPELEKWNNLVFSGESARAAYLKVAPKRKKTNKKSSVPSVVFTFPEIEKIMAHLGISSDIDDVKVAKKIILEHINNG